MNETEIIQEARKIGPVQIDSKYVSEQALLAFLKYKDDSVAIVGYSWKTGEPLFTASVWLPDPPAEGCVWLKGWEENEGIPQALVERGIVRLTGQTCNTGFCEAIEARLLV